MNETNFYMTRGLLNKLGACYWQKQTFTNIFGRRGKVFLTHENVDKAIQGGLSIGWLIMRMRWRVTTDNRYSTRLSKEEAAVIDAGSCAYYRDTTFLSTSTPAKIQRIFDALVVLSSKLNEQRLSGKPARASQSVPRRKT